MTRSRDNLSLQRLSAELLLKDATYFIWRIEAAERYEAAMQTAVAFLNEPPDPSKPQVVITTVSVFLENELRAIKADRPDTKAMIKRIRVALEEAT